MQHKLGSWEKEYTFQPNIMAAKDDWRHQRKPVYMYPPRHSNSTRNDVKFIQDSTLGVSFHRHPVGLPKPNQGKIRPSTSRMDPLVADRLPNADTSVYRVNKSNYRTSSTPSGDAKIREGRVGSAVSTIRSLNRSGTRQGTMGHTMPNSLADEYYRVTTADDRHSHNASQHNDINGSREHATHPLESRERMYRESVRDRRNEHLRTGTVEPEWERQRVLMDLVGSKSAEQLIDQGYDPRYRPVGGMLDVRNSHRTMSARDRSALTHTLFPENFRKSAGVNKTQDAHQQPISTKELTQPYFHRDHRSEYQSQSQQHEYLATKVPHHHGRDQDFQSSASYRSGLYNLPSGSIPAEASFQSIASRYGTSNAVDTSYYPHPQSRPLPPSVDDIKLFHGSRGPLYVTPDMHSDVPHSEPVLSPPRAYGNQSHSFHDAYPHFSSTPHFIDHTPPPMAGNERPMVISSAMAGRAGPILFDGEHTPTPPPEPYRDDREAYVPDDDQGYVRLSPEQVRLAQRQLDRSVTTHQW